jgi:hypothetical protein
VGDAARVDDMAKQAQVGKVESHGRYPSFVLDEGKLFILPIVSSKIEDNISSWTK